MDRAIKEGQLHVLQPKFGKRYWKKNWFVLYPASQYGISRLEFYDSKDGANVSEKQATKKLDKKIIRLSDCISIAHMPSEACPKDCMSAFTIETGEKLYTFAAEKQTSAEWVEKLCETAFPPLAADPCCGANSKPLEMAENSIYYSRSEVNEFWVNVQKTEAAERCDLHGTYILKADNENLLLKDTKTNQVLFNWPYKLLRRYGRDKVMFSFEAGRRCDSGPGNFTFETKNGNDIFLMVESSILEQKAQAESNRSSYHQPEPADGSCCPASASPERPSDHLLAAESPPPPPDSAGSKKEQVSRSSEEKDLAKLLKSRSLPDPPTAAPLTPPRSPVPKMPKAVVNADPASIYSDPVDALTASKCHTDSLYSDPLDSVAHKGTQPKAQGTQGPSRHGFKDGKRTEPLYADIYERVSYDLSRVAIRPRIEDHIYDEPEGRAPPPNQHPTEGRAPHPLPAPTQATIYDEAQLGDRDAWKRKGSGVVVGHEIPYNPNTDDYSVPPSLRSGEPPVSKGRRPKPLPAPKPTGSPFVKERRPDFKETGRELIGSVSERVTVKGNFNSSNNCIYSKVVKTKRPEKEVSVDEISINQESIYEDLGNL
ncbi:docking protein 1b [Heptranchias perlo]|uniref:docking protein 1b n=1 Tax=Heptranchias perlo TaxID=212740 RepID=UPI00355AA18B